MAEEFVSLNSHEIVPYADTNIVSIQNKVVQSFDNQLSLRGESYSQYIVFEMDRYYDGIDLTNGLLLQIAYLRSDGQGDNCPAVNVAYSEEHIRFAWLVPPAAVQEPGTLKVMPFAYGIVDNKEYILKTAYAEYNVQDTIELESIVTEPTDNWYTQFLYQIQLIGNFADAIEQTTRLSATASAAANDAQAASSAALSYQQGADASASTAEAWAVGQRNGNNVASDDATYQNNAKYYAERAAASATEARGSLTLGIDQYDGLLYVYLNGVKQGTGISLG